MKRNLTSTRFGSLPRTIYYPPSTLGHTFDFKTPCEDLKGRTSKHIPLKPSIEYSNFRKKKIKIQPNSKRTINPEFSPDNNNKKKINNIIYTNYNNNLPVRNSSKKTFKEKNKSNIEFNDFSYEIFPVKNNNSICENIKKKYDYKTEIINLPGSVKRDNNDIKDDIFTIYNKRKGTAFSIKNEQLYQSKIKCLNGNYNERPIINMKKNCMRISTDYNNNAIKKGINNFRNTNYYNSFSNGDLNNCVNSNYDNDISGNHKKQFKNNHKEIFSVLHQEPLKTKYKYSYKNLSQFIIS